MDQKDATWNRGFGSRPVKNALELIIRYHPNCQYIIDPFCGEGMSLALANHLGINAIGIELNKKRVIKAEKFQYTESCP